MKWELHHTGCLVESIKESIDLYRTIFGEDKVSSVVDVSSQGVKVCFVETAPNVFLELIEPSSEDSVVARLLKKNVRYYHVAYLTENFDQDIVSLTEQYSKHLNTFYSEAFQGKRCAFLYLPDGSLIELIEK
ncbi:MAG TPA: VOC family protein [Cytophagaceae bacterium]|jgi:methylmalonyl-CoA/ethylmalonyl-CoA epimerase|nr:VOC family protein [Cytophagaceae bacterium]